MNSKLKIHIEKGIGRIGLYIYFFTLPVILPGAGTVAGDSLHLLGDGAVVLGAAHVVEPDRHVLALTALAYKVFYYKKKSLTCVLTHMILSLLVHA